MNKLCCWVILGLLAGCSNGQGVDDAQETLALALLQSTDKTGFEQAERGRAIEFPRDHGPHRGYRTEWWYVVGNLEGVGQRRFGYQLTFFRNALAPPVDVQVDEGESQSAWRTNQVYMAHFAITDAKNETFIHTERFSRASLGLAGSQADPLRVWLGDWIMANDQTQPVCENCLNLQVQATHENNAINLNLQSTKPTVLQGDRGYSVKSNAQQTASHYYSMTRLATQGHVTIDGESFAVTGSSWFDREWSTSSLAEDQQGWDWFALQTVDGYELMVYQMRLTDGSRDLASSGVLVAPDGQVTAISAEQFDVSPNRYWTDEKNGRRYPVGWQLRVSKHAIDLSISAVMDHQAHDGAFQYWEGAVDFTGTLANQATTGWGYLELNGY